MERMKRLERLWSWLPAFRAVAETQHLPTAARWLCVTPPALSRSIRLLEEHLGRPLFDRVGRRLVLNSAGERLLHAVRRGMRSLDDAVTELTGPSLRGPLRVAAPVPIIEQLILPALTCVLAEHPHLKPELFAIEGVDIAVELKTGAMDLAISQEVEADADLRIDHLVTLSNGLYCGRNHPLFDSPNPTVADVSAHPFVELHDTHPPWPPNLPRTIGARVAYIDWALRLCLTGRFLAVLPQALAGGHEAEGALRPLPIDGIDSRTLYSARRPPLRDETPEGVLLTAMATLVDVRRDQLMQAAQA